MPAELLSEIGNIGRAHSNGSNVEVEVTRDLNLPAEDFAHEDSCWWQSYYHGRCALKSNGGFGLRSFGYDEHEEYEYVVGPWANPYYTDPATGMPRNYVPTGKIVRTPAVTGRAWVMPLRYVDGDFRPTFDAETPDALVVFNGYGDLEGYTPARIVAGMYGMTYRKVNFYADPMYVNGNAGYLVASEEIAANYDGGSVSLRTPQHANIYNDERALANA